MKPSVPPSGFVWQPDEATRANARLTEFMGRHGHQRFDEFHAHTVQDPAWFHEALLDFLDIHFHKPYDNILDLSRGPAWPRWCVGGGLNIVTNCLDKYAGTEVAAQTALIWENEQGESGALSYQQLLERVNQAANGLRQLGLGRGDAVGLYMPLTANEAVALLAVAKIGAIILPLFSGYGASAVASRLEDGSAKALITADGYLRNGSLVDMKSTADQAVARAPSVQHVIVEQVSGSPVSMVAGRDHWWHQLIEGQPTEAEPAATAAEDPLMIIYTSGTTGRPKGALHTHCGFPIKAAQDMAFGMDVHAGERIYWITDMGWMMGPWLVFGSLLLGATMFLYDGGPMQPDAGRVWQMIAKHSINQLGLSPTYVRALIPHGAETIQQHQLDSLRLIGATGEAWTLEPWNWLFEAACERRKPIINYTGGTELSGGIAMGNPLMPLKPTAISAPCPGMAADVFNQQGESVVGEVGELVIKSPWIGMTRGFWQDPERYEETYWSRWPGVWVHGDWALVDEDGSWYVLGRSDDTLKIAGKRLGPAEVETILIRHPAVVEGAAIGVPHPIKGTTLVAFCVLAESGEDPDKVRETLRQWLIDELGKPFEPERIVFLSDLPKTRNAKVMRRMLRSAFLGEDPGDTSALVNPQVLAEVGSANQ